MKRSRKSLVDSNESHEKALESPPPKLVKLTEIERSAKNKSKVGGALFNNSTDNNQFVSILNTLKSIGWLNMYNIDIPHDILKIIAFNATGTIILCDICFETETFVIYDANYHLPHETIPYKCNSSDCGKILVCCQGSNDSDLSHQCYMCECHYCNDCSSSQIISCGDCNKNFCRKCKKSARLCRYCKVSVCTKCESDRNGIPFFDTCQRCSIKICESCSEMSTCNDCNRMYCQNCGEFGQCGACYKEYCNDCCENTTQCDFCGQVYCIQCEWLVLTSIAQGEICSQCKQNKVYDDYDE